MARCILQSYIELNVGYDALHTSFFGTPSIATRNGYEVSLANFTVLNGANRLMATDGIVGGGVVESGSSKTGK